MNDPEKQKKTTFMLNVNNKKVKKKIMETVHGKA